MTLRLTVNGVAHELPDDLAGRSLLRVLRDELGLTGTKNACEEGECGSCTVAIDGEIACACLVLTAQADGTRVETIEGVDHPLQQAFVEAGAVQCGFCTPGLIMAARDLLERRPDPTEDEVREALSGNLCRCTGYTKIVQAVLAAAEARA